MAGLRFWRKAATAADDGDSVRDTVALGIAREEQAGLAYVFWGRLLVLGMLALWVVTTLPLARSELYVAAIAAFAVLGAPPYFLARLGFARSPVMILFVLLDAAILAYILIVPPPFFAGGWTPQLNLRLPNFLYMGVFLVGMALSYSPALVIWAGIASIAAWSAGVIWVVNLPGSIAYSSREVLDTGLSADAIIKNFLDPRTVGLTAWYNQIVFLVAVTAILAVSVWRSRRLVTRQVAAEAGRAALSRYFSPNIVDELAESRRAFDQPEVKPVAVLFADMVGFTAISERLPPEKLVALLREFHGRLARVAFGHGGTVDKYIGDAIMVHFGTPRAAPDDAARALACASAMLDEIGQWNGERQAKNLPPVALGIGVHYGEALVGNIGDARRLEYTVLGDTVNVASRLEGLTRETGTPLIISDALAVAVRGCGGAALLERLRPDTARTVRGRKEPVAIWCLVVAQGTAPAAPALTSHSR